MINKFNQYKEVRSKADAILSELQYLNITGGAIIDVDTSGLTSENKKNVDVIVASLNEISDIADSIQRCQSGVVDDSRPELDALSSVVRNIKDSLLLLSDKVKQTQSSVEDPDIGEQADE
jgi:hypothetical protein